MAGWPGRRICEELVSQGLGAQIDECLVRKRPVRKSAFADPGTRPTPQEHLESMAVRPVLAVPARVTVVDDFITKGATLIAACSLVSELFPEADVSAFAMIRTVGYGEIVKIVEPCIGVVRMNAYGGADRVP